jgi:cytochrome c553
MATAFGQQPPAADPERAFAFGDADLDGRLSPAEFRELISGLARRKVAAVPKAAGFAAPIFARLDLDHDGYLSIVEYRRLSELRRGAGGVLAKKAALQRKGTGSAPKSLDAPPARADRALTAEDRRFFESKIRPVLMKSCAPCHSQTTEKLKGGLFVDSRAGLLRGGDTGPAVVPGQLGESLLITAIRYQDESLRMPPKAKLPDTVIADFERWVSMGAPDPRGETEASIRRAGPAPDVEKGQQFWAFQPPHRATPGTVDDSGWPRSIIDRFLLTALNAQNLKPVEDADRNVLIRRVTFDLVGMPPTPDEVRAFALDDSPGAFARVVDRLLASPRFGERWGRHWLDVARFAESSGKANMLYPQAWRYRDWVIAAFNADKPYDQFVKEQIAGDLLPASDDRERAQHQIATGFLALGSKTHNMQDRRQFLMDLADEQIDVVSQAFLGLTIACARCHDHKFDPISQRDYYALSGVFQSTQTCYGTLPGLVQNANPSPLIELPATAGEPAAVPALKGASRDELEARVAELVKARDALTADMLGTPKAFQTRTRLAIARFRLASYRPDGTPRSYAMGVRERFEPIDSPLYVRGELDHPSESGVPRGYIRLLENGRPLSIRQGSGRRELAERLASADNPLVARVMVNRVWQHFFGRGLVATPDNFGMAGQAASHPELLDTLAVNFMSRNFSVKQLIREIVLSHAYQLASSHDRRAFEVDPDNTLIWRMSPRRLEAEALRDAVLAISGQLDLRPPIGSAVALAGEGPARPVRGFSQDSQDMHRAVYLPVVRDQVPESLALFDFADPSLVTGERATTSGPAQALFLMNSPFVIRQAAFAAAALQPQGETPEARIEAAYFRFLARKPSPVELSRASAFLANFDGRSGHASTALLPTLKAWTAFCQALYASAEFRYLD